MNLDARLHDPSFLLEQDARLRALARRLVHDAAQADDVVQETWMQALRGSHRVESRIAGWLSGITRHVAFGKRREDRSRARRERDSEPPSPTPSTEELFAREAARRAVVDAVMQLAEPARAVVVLRFFDDLSSRQIAAQLDVPIETVRTRLKRALEQLRRELDRRHGGDGRAWCAVLAPIAIAKKAAAAGSFAIAGVAAGILVFATAGILTLAHSRTAARVDSGPAPLVASNAQTDSVAATPAAPVRSPVDAEPVTTPSVSASNVSGRVIDEQGRPIADARVFLTQQFFEAGSAHDDREGTTNTRADGTFVFEAVPLRGVASGAKRSDTVYAEHPTFAGQTVVLERRSDIAIVLLRRVRLEGTIRDAASHAPLSGIPVALQRPFIFATRETLARTVSDAGGRYSFDAAPQTDIIVCAQRTGETPTLVPSFVGLDPVSTLDIDIAPTRSVVIEVRTLMSHEPLAGVQVLVGPQNGGESERVAPCTTDGGGRCELANVPNSGVMASIVDEAAGMTIQFAIPPADTESRGAPLTLVVPEPWTVRGRLLEPDGSPMVGAIVSVDFPPRVMSGLDGPTLVRRYGSSMAPIQRIGRIGFRKVETSADGTFALLHPVFGDVVRVAATRRGGEVSHVVATLDQPRPASTHDVGTVTLPRHGALFTQVVYAPTNIPYPIVEAVHGSRRERWTSDRGAAFMKWDLEPGTWTLAASAPGLEASDPITVEIVEEKKSEICLNLATDPEEDPVTSGIAIDSEGKPLPRAQISAYQAVGEHVEVPTNDPIARERASRPLEHWFQTDDAGRFEIRTPRVLTTPLSFTMSGSDFGYLTTAQPGSTNVIVRQPAFAHFRIRLVDSGGANLTIPIVLEWKVSDAFKAIPSRWGCSPSAAGIMSFSCPEGPQTLRVRRPQDDVGRAVIVDVDARTNDDASAPTIVVP